MSEIAKKRGRRRKTPFVSVLSPEKAAEIRGDAPLTKETDEMAAARREAERQRGIARRAEAKREKQVEGITSPQELWALNREALGADLNTLLERESRVLDLVHWADGVLAGTNNPDDECYVSVEEGSADLFQHVQKHGVVAMELILVPEYWKNADLYQRFQGSDPDSIFARTGIITAMPGHKVHQFEKYLRAATTTTTPVATSGNGYTALSCTTSGCTSWPEAVPISIAEDYEKLGKPFQCRRCLDLERKSRAISRAEIGKGTLYQSPDSHAVFDGFGRIRT